MGAGIGARTFGATDGGAPGQRDRVLDIGLLGGSFNPPHLCHLLASIWLLEGGVFSQVWWLPVHVHAFCKDRELAPFEDRVAMCEAVAAGYDGIRVDPIEADLGPRSYTIDTVGALRARHPGTGFGWIVGSDLLAELPRWHRWDELRRELTFHVIGRGGTEAAAPPEGRFVVHPLRLPDLSSTAVREMLRRGDLDRARGCVPRAVAAWLAAHPGMYRG